MNFTFFLFFNFFIFACVLSEQFVGGILVMNFWMKSVYLVWGVYFCFSVRFCFVFCLFVVDPSSYWIHKFILIFMITFLILFITAIIEIAFDKILCHFYSKLLIHNLLMVNRPKLKPKLENINDINNCKKWFYM